VKICGITGVLTETTFHFSDQILQNAIFQGHNLGMSGEKLGRQKLSRKGNHFILFNPTR